MSSVGSRVSVGALVLSGAQLGIKFVDLIALTVLAKILLPEDFGLTAIGTTTLALVRAASDLPVFSALLREPSVSRAQIDTAFSLTGLRGVAVGLVMVVASFPLAALYGDPRVVAVLAVLGLAPIAQGLESGGKLFLLRDLRFRPIAVGQLVGKLASFVVAVATVLLTHSYWAIVGGLVAAPVVTTLASYVYAPYRPRFSLVGARGLMAFTGWLTVGQLLGTLNVQSDRYFVGAILGTQALGFYAVAGNLADTATLGLAAPIVQPLLSGLARFNDDRPRLGRAYLVAQQTLAAAILPIGVLLSFASGPVVSAALGPEWATSSMLLVWLAPAVALQALSLPVHSLILAAGETRWLAGREAIFLVVRLVPTILAAWLFGLQAAVIVRAGTGVLRMIFNFGLVSRLVGLSIWSQVRALNRTFVSLGAMALVLAAMDSLMTPQSGSTGEVIALGASLLAGCLAYVSCHLLLWRRAGRPDEAERKFLGLGRRLLEAAPFAWPVPKVSS